MTAPICRGSLLQSVSGLAAMLAASPACGLLPQASASRFNRYAVPVNTGPSSPTVPAVGATGGCRERRTLCDGVRLDLHGPADHRLSREWLFHGGHS